jgi:Flp pilus assembly protein TadD
MRIWAVILLATIHLSRGAMADEAAGGKSADPSTSNDPKATPSQADVHFARAQVAHQKGDYRTAIAEYTAAVRLEPKRAELFVGRGKAQASRGDLRRALADFDLALRHDPESDAAYTARADAWRVKGDFARAKADYDEALRIAPTNLVAGCNMAWLLATCPQDELRDGRRAVKLAVQAQETKKDEPELMDTRAAAYAEAGDFDNARTWEIRALKLAAEKNRVLEGGEERLELYQAGKPYHELPPKK